MSCIHYKFKSSIDYNSVTFDGLHLSLGDLKKAISAQKRLKPGDFDLEITNAQTADVYQKTDELIAKNTSVIVSRVPVTKTTASSTQKSWEAFKQKCAKVVRVKLKEQERQMTLEKLKQAPDLASSQASEIDKIKAVIDLSTKGFEPSSLPGRHPLAVPSDSYVCKRCGKKGHFFTHCPNMKAEDRIIEPRVKRTTGIPSTMLTIVDDPLHPGALLTSRGQFAVPKVDAEAYRESKKERPPFLPCETNAEPEKKKIPQELLCHICEDLCVDAAIAPCCGTSFCDECLREVLLESDDHQCPSCHETNVSPDRIVANRSMRIAVTNFLNDTGYTKMRRRRSSSAGGDKAPAQEVENPVVPQNTLNTNTLMSSSNTIMSSSAVAIRPGASIQSTNISSTSTTSFEEVAHPTHSAIYQPPRGHPRPGFSGAYHNYPAPHHHPSSQGYPPRYWLRHKDPSGHHNVIRGDGPRHSRPNKYMPVDKNNWNMKPTASLVTALVPNIAAVASQAVQAAQAALLGRGHPVMNVPPPTHMPFTALTGYPQNYVRPEIPHSNVIPVQASYVPPVEPPKPLSEEDFYKTQKLMQSSVLPKKSVDVFDSFADLTKMRSPTPELRSRSTSPTGTPPRKKSRSRSISPLSRGLSPRRIHTRSRSHSRPRSLLRSRSRSRQKSQLSPSQSHLKNRSRTRSPVQSHHSKVHSNSKSPLRRSKLRSRSRSPNRLSKARSRSLSPLPPLKRSSKSPTSLRSRSRSRSFKRTLRTRSRSWSRPRRSRSRTYSPLPRSPKRSSWRSPRRSPHSSLSLRRSYSPRRRSRSYSPKRKSPYRSRTRSPPIRKRYSRSGSRSPRPFRRSFSPVGGRRSKSPYRRPLSPLPQKRRSPSPFYGGGGGFKGRGRGRGGFNRDGFRSDRERPRHYPSPPRHPNANTTTAPNRPPPDAPSHFPPVPYLPSMGIPPPEEYFKYNPAGYEEFVRNFYAQIGSQPPAWNAQQGTIPPPPINHYPPGQAPAPPDQPVNRITWDAVNMPPAQRAHHSYAPPGMVANPGDINHRDNNRPILNERDRNREEMGRDRRMDERRFDDRDRRGDSRERRFHNKDRRVDSRDRRMDDRERRFEDKDRRMDDKERRGDRDKGRDFERRRDSDRNKEKDYDKPRESRRSRDKVSSEKKRSPQRRNSKEADRNKAKEKKKVDKNKETKDKAKSRSKIEKGDTEEIHTPKDTCDDIRKEAVHEKDTSELDAKPSMSDYLKPERESDIKSEDNLSKTAENAPSDTNKPPSDIDLSNVKEKKVTSKKKTGAVGLKKMKGKDSASDSAAPGEKKGKKTKKKKLTFGSSDADNKQGLKKKKLKRLVDYKSENNCLSEDGDHEKAGVSPLKKSKVEDGDAPSSGQDVKAEKDLEVPKADIKSETSLAHSEDAGSPSHADTGDVKLTEKTLEKVKTDLIPELPELSKWERDDFDLLDTLEAPKEKPKEKLMVPRSIVDKAEKFLSQKPMKNSVVALATSASNKSEDETVPPKHRRSRSKSPVPKPARKVYMDSRKDFKEKKSMDLQITVKGDKRKNESTSKKISLSSHKSNEDSFRRSHHYHSKELDYEEDERSVVKSSSLERELKDDRSPVYRDRKGGSRHERTARDRNTKYDSSKKDQDRHYGKPKEKSPPSRKTNRARHPSKEEKESKGSFVKSSKDLRARIEEKTKAKSSVESRKMSVMDESEFVPDYEDLGPDSTSDNDHTSQMSAASSHDEKEMRKRKNDEEDEGGDLSAGKHKKAKKKHKHKEKKEKKEKHKHKKKKHKQKKSKSKERDDD